MEICKIIETGNIWKINNIIVDDWFNNKTIQILSYNDKVFVYKKDINKLYEISFKNALKLVINLEHRLSYLKYL